MSESFDDLMKRLPEMGGMEIVVFRVKRPAAVQRLWAMDKCGDGEILREIPAAEYAHLAKLLAAYRQGGRAFLERLDRVRTELVTLLDERDRAPAEPPGQQFLFQTPK